MIAPKVWIISSVPADPFKNLDFDSLHFDSLEKAAALTPEINLFLNTLDQEYLKQSGIKFEIIRALDNKLPKVWEYDALMLWWSPAMVNEKNEKPWIGWLLDFVNKEVNNWTPVLWMCFWHQILVSAFWGKVDDMTSWRHLWPASIMLNADGKWDEIFSQIDEQFTSLYSHKQSVIDLGEAKVLWLASHDPYSVVKVWNDAWWVQFHPEFRPETVSFLAKLMKWQLESEWLDMKKIIGDARSQAWNDWSKIIQLFLKKYWNK